MFPLRSTRTRFESPFNAPPGTYNKVPLFETLYAAAPPWCSSTHLPRRELESREPLAARDRIGRPIMIRHARRRDDPSASIGHSFLLESRCAALSLQVRS